MDAIKLGDARHEADQRKIRSLEAPLAEANKSKHVETVVKEEPVEGRQHESV